MNSYSLLGVIVLAIWATSWQLERTAFSGHKLSSLNYSWFVASWLPGIVLLSLPIYVFPENFSVEDALYLGGVHGIFAFGSFLGLLFSKKTYRRPSYFPLTKNVVLIFLLIGIFAQILNGIDSLMSGSMSFSDRLSVVNLADLKSEYTNYDQSQTFLGSLAGLVRYLIGIGQIGILAYSYGSANKAFPKSRLLTGPFIFLLIISCFNSWFITAGRLGIIITILFAFVPSTLRIAAQIGGKVRKTKSQRNWLSYAFPGVALVFGIYYLSTTFLVGRLGNIDALTALNLVHRATIDPHSASVINGDDALQIMVFQASYLSNPIPTAAFYINKEPNDLPGPHWGGLNFLLEAALFQKLLGISADPDAGNAMQYDVESPLLRAGYFGGVWCTMVRELLIDFGHWGIFIFFFLFGLTSGSLQGSIAYRPTIPKAVLFSLLRIQMLWSGFHSLLYHRLFSYAFFIALIILLISAIFSVTGRARGSIRNEPIQSQST